jgi:hypothetical protein
MKEEQKNSLYEYKNQRAVNYTIHNGKFNRFVHVMPNYTTHESLKQNPEYAAKLRAALKANLHNSCQQPICELHGNQIVNDWLHDLYDMGYHVAVVWFDGSWPLGPEFEREVHDCLDNHWVEKWLAAGFIYNNMPNGEYPRFDQRYPVIFNLKYWAEINFPDIIFNKPGAISFETFVNDAINDTYPKYMFRSGLYKSAVEGNGMFDGCIGQALKQESGHVYGLAHEDMINYVHASDPDKNTEFVLSWIHERNLDESSQDIFEHRSKMDTMDQDIRELYELKLLKYQMVYVTNTEAIPKDYNFGATDQEFSALILPCSGLHQLYHIYHNLESLEEVIWYDFNPYSVAWMRQVIENWDGLDFETFYQNNKHVIIDDEVIREENIIFDLEHVNNFQEVMGLSRQDWEDFMLEVKKLDHKFLNIDVVKDNQPIVDGLEPGHDVHIQLTNIWQYEVNYLNTDLFEAQLSFINLMNNLAKKHRNVYLTGDTPSGVHYRYKNIKELKGF